LKAWLNTKVTKDTKRVMTWVASPNNQLLLRRYFDSENTSRFNRRFVILVGFVFNCPDHNSASLCSIKYCHPLVRAPVSCRDWSERRSVVRPYSTSFIRAMAVVVATFNEFKCVSRL